MPLTKIVWLAFAALSKMVTVADIGPGEAGVNCTVISHFFFGNST